MPPFVESNFDNYIHAPLIQSYYRESSSRTVIQMLYMINHIFYTTSKLTQNPDMYSTVSKLATKLPERHGALPRISIHLAMGDRKHLYPSPKYPFSTYNPYTTERGFQTPKIPFQRVLDEVETKRLSLHIYFHHERSMLIFHWPNLTFSFCNYTCFSTILSTLDQQ